jgi:hypothetical protein
MQRQSRISVENQPAALPARRASKRIQQPGFSEKTGFLAPSHPSKQTGGKMYRRATIVFPPIDCKRHDRSETA